MKIFIQIIVLIGCTASIGVVVFAIFILLKKVIYQPPNSQTQDPDKTSKYFFALALCLFLSFTSFLGGKELIRRDFHKALKEKKIVSVEANGFFFSQEDSADLFTKFDSDPGRYHCDTFLGSINFENNEYIPIEIIRHCYERNQYIIISKQYPLDATIGIIYTSKFDFIQNDSISVSQP